MSIRKTDWIGLLVCAVIGAALCLPMIGRAATGNIIVPNSPMMSNVSAIAANALPKAGGAMTGDIDLGGHKIKNGDGSGLTGVSGGSGRPAGYANISGLAVAANTKIAFNDVTGRLAGTLQNDSTVVWSGDRRWHKRTSGGGGGGSGTVTSVALTVPSILSVSGSPITTSGTLALSLTSQSANNVLIAPDGTSGNPTFRALLSADIPTLSYIPKGLSGNIAIYSAPFAPSTTIVSAYKAAGYTDVAWTNSTSVVPIVDTASAQTLTNKRITLRVVSITSSATPAINTDVTDQFEITALAAAITSMTSGLTGTPVDGDQLLIKIKDNGTARAITWGTSFINGVATLPTTTIISKNLWCGFTWSVSSTAWKCQFTASEQ